MAFCFFLYRHVSPSLRNDSFFYTVLGNINQKFSTVCSEIVALMASSLTRTVFDHGCNRYVATAVVSMTKSTPLTTQILISHVVSGCDNDVKAWTDVLKRTRCFLALVIWIFQPPCAPFWGCPTVKVWHCHNGLCIGCLHSHAVDNGYRGVARTRVTTIQKVWTLNLFMIGEDGPSTKLGTFMTEFLHCV